MVDMANVGTPLQLCAKCGMCKSTSTPGVCFLLIGVTFSLPAATFGSRSSHCRNPLCRHPKIPAPRGQRALACSSKRSLESPTPTSGVCCSALQKTRPRSTVLWYLCELGDACILFCYIIKFTRTLRIHRMKSGPWMQQQCLRSLSRSLLTHGSPSPPLRIAWVSYFLGMPIRECWRRPRRTRPTSDPCP